MTTFRKRGKRWQVIIRKSGQPAALKTFTNKAQAKIWARGVENDMDRQAWEDPTLLKEKTVDDVIAAMHAQQDAGKAQQTAHNNLSRDLGNVYVNGHYLCTINQTLRVLQSTFDCERCINAMQTLIDQHPVGFEPVRYIPD